MALLALFLVKIIIVKIRDEVRRRNSDSKYLGNSDKKANVKEKLIATETEDEEAVYRTPKKLSDDATS